jgi:hypothetical protein
MTITITIDTDEPDAVVAVISVVAETGLNFFVQWVDDVADVEAVLSGIPAVTPPTDAAVAGTVAPRVQDPYMALRALAVACPVCGAAEDVWCASEATGRPTVGHYHANRMTLAVTMAGAS